MTCMPKCSVELWQWQASQAMLYLSSCPPMAVWRNCSVSNTICLHPASTLSATLLIPHNDFAKYVPQSLLDMSLHYCTHFAMSRTFCQSRHLHPLPAGMNVCHLSCLVIYKGNRHTIGGHDGRSSSRQGAYHCIGIMYVKPSGSHGLTLDCHAPD